MKRIKFVALSVLAAATLLSSCNAGGFPAQTDPSTEQFRNGYGGYVVDIEPEQDYRSITAFTDKDVYPLDFDKITVTVKNENAGKGFYFFDIPVIEYNDNGKWVRLNYSPKSYEIPEQWAFCGIENAPDRQFSTVMSIFSDRLEGKWKTGEYRAVVFAGTETIYAPFGISETAGIDETELPESTGPASKTLSDAEIAEIKDSCLRLTGTLEKDENTIYILVEGANEYFSDQEKVRVTSTNKDITFDDCSDGDKVTLWTGMILDSLPRGVNVVYYEKQ